MKGNNPKETPLNETRDLKDNLNNMTTSMLDLIK